MYVKLSGGRQNAAGYIVPCEVVREVKDERGGVIGAYVRLSSEDGAYEWVQYAKIGDLINDDEAERE